MSAWMSSGDKTNVLLEKLTQCVADRTIACEQRLDSIEEKVKCLLQQNVEQTKNNDEIAGTIKTLNKQMVTLSQQLLSITQLLLKIIGKKGP